MALTIKEFNSALDGISEQEPGTQVSQLLESYRQEFNRQYQELSKNGGNIDALQELLEMIMAQLRSILRQDSWSNAGGQSDSNPSSIQVGASSHSANSGNAANSGNIGGHTLNAVTEPSSVSGPPPTTSKTASIDSSSFSTTMPEGRLSEDEGKQLAVQVMNRLIKEYGLTPEQAAGIVGNLYMESAGMNPHANQFSQFSGGASNPDAFGDPSGARVQDNTGYGWAQWGESRKDGLIQYAKANNMDPGSSAANLGFLMQELSSPSEGQVIQSLKKTESVEEAMMVFRRDYERAAVGGAADGERLNSAQDIYELYMNQYG
ncbi:hypothetical protein BTA51_02295 [Hahella sp. CCB-MM4]|uniref:phage tail tip lysozyme n=1 Tax=Hahella sp. (strain CCB-MM4) TaxID=1926491 RepID=UPI000B9B2965|nr:phage tail tip lysozyme [Hahella sp. CCB-MM4]OZG75235.1 hypothetical protein BTA51_02295 [Hahella sp. CCB-MM4]